MDDKFAAMNICQNDVCGREELTEIAIIDNQPFVLRFLFMATSITITLNGENEYKLSLPWAVYDMIDVVVAGSADVSSITTVLTATMETSSIFVVRETTRHSPIYKNVCI
jgi:hypothetical protein